MRIKTYNQNRMLISDLEIKCNVPKYVREFDNSRPLVNISSDDHRLLNSKSESIEKVLLIERYRQILQYDYSLYLVSNYSHNVMFHLLPRYKRSITEVSDIIHDKKDWLVKLIRYSKELSDVKNAYPVSQANLAIWLDYINSESKCSWTSFYNEILLSDAFEKYKYSDYSDYEDHDRTWYYAKNYRSLLTTIQKEVYPELKKRSSQFARIKSILHLIPSKYSSHLQPYSFDDDNFIIRLCNVLYQTGSKRRSDLYGVVLAYNYMASAITNSSLNFLSIDSEDYSFTIDGKGDCKIDILATPQENATIRISSHSKRPISYYKKELQEAYNSYILKKARDIEKNTEGEFYTYVDLDINKDLIKPKHWKELYSKLRKDIALKKDLLGRSRPESYYYSVILKHDDIKNEIVFNDDFINDLLLINDRFHSIVLTDIFGYMYQFNYIKSKAYPEKSNIQDDQVTAPEDLFVWEDDYTKEYSLDESIERALSFISPILNRNYIEIDKNTGTLKKDPEQFRKEFRELFKKEGPESIKCILLRINEEYTGKKGRYPYQGFNYKLLFNIIGALKTNNDINKGARRIFKKESKFVTDELMLNRQSIKVKEGWTSFRKYLANYKSYAEDGSMQSYSILTAETIIFIQEHFNVKKDEFKNAVSHQKHK